jgi:hypothetical protein
MTIGLGAILAHLLLAQTPAVFGTGLESVSVDVLVTRMGAPLLGLRAEDFVVKDDGVPQRVEVVDRRTLPTTAVLVLDRSASVAGRELALLRAGARACLTQAPCRPISAQQQERGQRQ